MLNHHLTIATSGFLLILLIAACGPAEPTVTPLPPTTMLVAMTPTDIPVPPTSTAVPPSDTPKPTATDTPVPTSTPTATSTPVPTQQPSATPSAYTYEEVSLRTGDWLILAGYHFRPTASEEKPVAVLLAHEANASHYNWQSLAELLAQDGYPVLTFDFRGHGASEGVLDYSSVGVDVTAALRYLNRQGYDRIACVGASMGGSGCLAAAIDTALGGLVMMSSPMNIPGTRLVSRTDLANLTMPKLFMIAEEDTVINELPEFVEDFVQMHDWAPTPKELIIYPGQSHGTGLFHEREFGGEVQAKVIEFLQDLLP